MSVSQSLLFVISVDLHFRTAHLQDTIVSTLRQLQTICSHRQTSPSYSFCAFKKKIKKYKDSDLFCCCCCFVVVVVVFCRVLPLHSVVAYCKLDMVSGIYFTVRGLLVNSSGPPNHSATPYRWVYARNLDAAT